MSWLSSGLAKLGISKDAQRTALKVASPLTGGISGLFAGTPAAKQVQQPQQDGSMTWLQQGIAALLGQQPVAPKATAPTFWERNKWPIMLAGGAVVVGTGAYLVLRRR